MPQAKREHPKEKANLHPRNKHRERYDFKLLTNTCPELAAYVQINAYGDESVDFFDPEAVKWLNRALLKHYYQINHWDIPPHYLCPPIPGRADYIHYLADLLALSHNEKPPTGTQIRCLDVGVGANCVYPIIGRSEYGWSFVGSDIDPISIQAASETVRQNPILADHVELRLQKNTKDIFQGIIQAGDRFDLTLCNPPFHASQAEAQAGTLRKLSNLKGKTVKEATLNFGGQRNELWCEGGEERFVGTMVRQSKQFAKICCWFTSSISKQSNLESVYKALKNVEAKSVKTIQMGQGNKISRIVAWSFLEEEERREWANR